MGDLLLDTKVQVPHLRAARIARPRLLDLLDAGLSCPLTLVSAPAGFGKTTLVAEWISAVDRPCSWLTLDEGDSDPVRFLAYFVRALQQIEDETGSATLAALAGPGLPSRLGSLLPMLVNDINRIPEPFILVLDDYHLVDGKPVHEMLDFMVDHQPESMHLVITTRADPPLPLARLRARGLMSEIRQADLRFTPAEADDLLCQALGFGLEDSQVGKLTERTEGWIAGLQMAGLALQGLRAESGTRPSGVEEFIQTFGGTHRHVADYLVEEVLARQPEDVRAFLLQTSILDRMCGSLCDAVLAGKAFPTVAGAATSGQEMLEHLERANLFLSPFDDRREWYRYHRLFSDLLRLRLREAVHPGDITALHQKASAWYRAQGMLPDSVHHALQTADYEEAARLIERAAPPAWRHGELGTLLHWMESLPPDARRRHPLLSIYLGTIRLLRAEPFSEVEVMVHEAAESDREGQWSGEIALLQALLAMYRGETPRGLTLAQGAMVQLPPDSLFHGLATRALSALCLMEGDLASAEQLLEHDMAASERAGDWLGLSADLRRLGSLAALRGELRKAEICYTRALELSRDSGGRLWPLAGRIVIHLAELALEKNDLRSAEAQLAQASNLLEQFLPGWNSESYLLRARLDHARGDEAGARAMMRAAIDRARSTETSMDDVYIELQAARLAIWQGDLAEAERWAARWTRGAEPDARSPAQDIEALIRSHLFQEVGRTTLARFHLARGEPALAIEVLSPRLDGESGPFVWGNRVELLVLRALAHQAEGALEDAQRDMEQALELGEPEGFARTFLEEGEPMKSLLQVAARRGRMKAYAKRLLESMEMAAAEALVVPTTEDRTSRPPLIEPLTEREIEVLRLLQTSLTTPEMADQLGIAPSTVRTFVKNVYAKLGVHRRLEAVERARELGLLAA